METSITKSGNHGYIWILLSLILLLNQKTRKVGIISGLSLLGMYLINDEFLKNVFERIRPYDVIDGLIPIIKRPRSYSFPSGHTASSFAAAWVFYKRLPKQFGIPALIFATLMGLSR